MFRFYLRLALIPIALFTLVLILIHAQPYDDMHRILLPEGCPMPCFMGIRPGITTMKKAIRIIESSGWAYLYDDQSNPHIITLKWKRDSPHWLAKREGYIHIDTIDFATVDSIEIETNISLDEIQTILGQPPFNDLGKGNDSSYLYYMGGYPKFGIYLNDSVECDKNDKSLTYQDTITIEYLQPKNILQQMLDDFYASWADIPRLTCTGNKQQ